MSFTLDFIAGLDWGPFQLPDFSSPLRPDTHDPISPQHSDIPIRGLPSCFLSLSGKGCWPRGLDVYAVGSWRVSHLCREITCHCAGFILNYLCNNKING